MNFNNFSRAQFSKLRNGINGVGEFRYYTYVAKISYQLEIVRGADQNFTRHTHAEAHFMSLVFLRKGRNRLKTEGTRTPHILPRV